MSKIGRKPIVIGDVQVEVKGNEVHYNGKKDSGVYTLPDYLTAVIQDKQLLLEPTKNGRKVSRGQLYSQWGLHRALLTNKLMGAANEFEKKIEINGLGFKAAAAGSKMTFTLGYSHKIDFELPQGVTVEIDKTGQKLTFKSPNKELVGHVCSVVRSLRAPEPYKGTGIKLATEVIARKAGKTKAA